MDASLPQLIADYGYLAVFVGTLLEGEAILLLAAYAAHQGYLSLPAVIGVAFCGATLGDQIFFFSGRFFGNSLMRRLPLIRARAEKINALLLRYHAGLIIGIRFAYGLRIAGPIVIGMSSLDPRRFLVFNAIGAMLWAPLIAGIGYLFGHALEWLFADLKQYETLGLLALLLLFVVVSGIVHFARARREEDDASPKAD
ncbi:MAG TPA: DedA family protein [Caldimonas sp.]|nr:DedA family protein [Caldimonas sp.]